MLLVLRAVVSFRAVPRILKLTTSGGGRWVPHFTSVINWTLRVGLALLNQVTLIAEPWIAILDASINVGTQKALVVLRVPLANLEKRGSALCLGDCECIGLHILEKMNGETVAGCLTEVFNQAGAPVAVLKDKGGDLARGVRLWEAAHPHAEVEVIEDIGHSLANGLKAQFQKLAVFQGFLTLVTQGASRLRQTVWAFLTPPKIRTKGRFQSIGKLAQWGAKLLDLFDQEEKTGEEHEALAAIRKALPDFCKFRAFIKQFAESTQTVHDVLKHLKETGLNVATYETCHALAQTLPVRSKVKKRLLKWLDKHWAIQQKIAQGVFSLPVSTDIIESLFGKYKQVIARSPIADMNRTVLIIPALCGTPVNAQQLTTFFERSRHEDIERWEQSNVGYTVRKKRRAFFEREQHEKVPKTGNLT